jgi:hypothetical protein
MLPVLKCYVAFLWVARSSHKKQQSCYERGVSMVHDVVFALVFLAMITTPALVAMHHDGDKSETQQ